MHVCELYACVRACVLGVGLHFSRCGWGAWVVSGVGECVCSVGGLSFFGSNGPSPPLARCAMLVNVSPGDCCLRLSRAGGHLSEVDPALCGAEAFAGRIFGSLPAPGLLTL